MKLFVVILLAVLVFAVAAYTCEPFNPQTRKNTCAGDVKQEQYAPTTNPKFLGACRISDLPQIQDDINKLFTENKPCDPSLVRDVRLYITQDNTTVSFIYLSTGTGFTNRAGYALYHYDNHSVTEVQYVLPKVNTNGGEGCLKRGDTYKFGPFMAGQTMIFFMDPDTSETTRFWSYLDAPFGNPDTAECPPNGCMHSAWAYLTKYNVTLFGWEDESLGDRDYNDLMFLLDFEGGATYTPPPFTGETIHVCVQNTSVSTKSYAEVSCTQWGLLESTAAQSCLTYMSIPDGWTWARYDDPDALTAITTLASQWSYTGAQCFLLAFNQTSGLGYRPDGTPCAAEEYTFSSYTNGTKTCYNAQCTSRLVLRGADLGVGCSSSTSCAPGTAGSILAKQPTSPSSGVTQFPSAYSVFLRTLAGSVVDVATSIQIPFDPSAVQKVDVMVLADFSTVPASSNKHASIISSWTNLPSTFSANNLDAMIGFVQYQPTEAEPFYTLSSSYSLSANPDHLTSQNFPTTATSCPAAGRRKLLAAMRDVMYNNAINWRGDAAFKILWVFSTCAIDLTTDIKAAGMATGIVPIFVFPSSANFPEGWSNTGAYAVPLQTSYKTATNPSGLWMDPFQSYATGKGAHLIKGFPSLVLGVPASGDTSFISALPTSAISASSGVATLSYKIAWPSELAYNAASSGYTATVRVMGRGLTTFNIVFNHAPVINDLSYSLPSNMNKTITFTPSDSDGNLLNLVFSPYPSKGRLYTTNSGTLIPESQALPAGVYTVVYVPNAAATGADSFGVSTSDGCESDTATVSIALTLGNTPPVASDIIIYMDEDSLPTGTNGIIDFTDYISDADIDAGVSQSLTVRLNSLPSPFTYGELTSGTTYQAINAVGSIVGKVLRFNLTQPSSGHGSATFSYHVSDGTSDGNSLSNIALVTIVIRPINHPPVLSINPTSFDAVSGSASVVISGSIEDADNDEVNLYAVDSNLPTFSITADNTLTSASSLPFAFYTANQVTVNTFYSISGLTWQNPSGASEEWVTFRAQDSRGLWSNSVTVTFQTVTSNPPTWVDRPLSTYNIQQGQSAADLRFSATDADDDQYSSLIFSLVVNPANGLVRIKPLSSGSDITAAKNDNYSSTTNSGHIGTDGTLTPPVSFFTVEYVPNDGFSGTDRFTFNVRDIVGHYANEVATVVVNVARSLTAPESADAEIRTQELVPGSTSIPAFSTNDLGNDVLLNLVRLRFNGYLTLENGDQWIPGSNTSLVNSGINNGLLKISATSNFGVFSPDDNTPVGNFTYRVFEPSTGLYSTINYTGQIYITHLNHPPVSDNRVDTVKKRTPLKVTLSAYDPDGDDTPATNVQAYFRSIASWSKGDFFFDEAMTQPITSASFNNPLVARTFWYVSNNDFSSPINSPLAGYTFIVRDTHGLASTSTYQGSIIVTYAGDVPTFGDNLEVTTYQEIPIPMTLALGAKTESGADPIVSVTSLPPKGSFFVCHLDSSCSLTSSAPAVVTSSTGRVIFRPRDWDWGQNFSSFNFTLTDPLSGAVGYYTMTIHVIHVNKRPSIHASNFQTTTESSHGIIINESSWRPFDWKAYDVDSLPGTLTTSLRVAFYTTQGFEIYSCAYNNQEDWNTPRCAFAAGVDLPLAARADFAKNAKKSIVPYETSTSACPDFQILRDRMGVVSLDCEAHFKFAFVPTPTAHFTPYVTLTFTAVDDYGAESSPISALLFVKAINTAPTISSPPLVLGGVGVTDPFIVDASPGSPTYNNPVVVGDIDGNGNVELLTITVLEGYSGKLSWPESAHCSADSTIPQQWHCLDSISGFNSWLGALRFEVTSAARADLQFTINDLGNSGDYKPSPNLTASSTTSIRLTDAIAPTQGNNSTLAIAVGATAAAGLLLLGALGFFVKRAITPPSEDYFASATSPLDIAPQSPLYQPQNLEHTSALYKGM